ncbi:hypothetical protein KIL84_010779 [Mauremys mutica]|uniref:Secreted protein n=1 Tax=Mauremys mutica TaxID=74926 RepID=A0A9D3XCK0_9SAUR|nr:hypothetical protein KIL84_010779 [Mauremys mutica]
MSDLLCALFYLYTKMMASLCAAAAALGLLVHDQCCPPSSQSLAVPALQPPLVSQPPLRSTHARVCPCTHPCAHGHRGERSVGKSWSSTTRVVPVLVRFPLGPQSFSFTLKGASILVLSTSLYNCAFLGKKWIGNCNF